MAAEAKTEQRAAARSVMPPEARTARVTRSGHWTLSPRPVTTRPMRTTAPDSDTQAMAKPITATATDSCRILSME